MAEPTSGFNPFDLVAPTKVLCPVYQPLRRSLTERTTSMSYGYKDAYNSPELFDDLELFGELDEDDMCYEFNMFAVWRNTKTGTWYWSSDSGCSCPSPFEDCTTIDTLNAEDTWSAVAKNAYDWMPNTGPDMVGALGELIMKMANAPEVS